MTIPQMIESLGLRVLASGHEQTEELTGYYIGDLLSRVISRAEPGGAWITIMNNLNVAAVAVLADIPAIILAEGVQPDADLSKKCEDEGIWLLGSDRSAFELVCSLRPNA